MSERIPKKQSRLIVTLSSDPELAAHAHSEIVKHAAIVVDDFEGHYLPILIEESNLQVAILWLRKLPGLLKVELASPRQRLSGGDDEVA